MMPESVAGRLEAVYENGDVKYWKAFKASGKKVQGYVFIAKRYGYSSDIETMVGMKRDGTITGVRIISQNETPGLGAKITELASSKTLIKALKGLFSKEKEQVKKLSPYFTEQFKGLNIRRLEFSMGEVEAITGATISSSACLDSIKEEGMEILNAR